MNEATGASILSTLAETRVFDPPGTGRLKGADWRIASMQEYERLHARSIEDPDAFWGEIAAQLRFFTPWNSVLSGEMPDAKWFEGATTNVCFNCVDRHVEEGHGDDVAIIWEGEPVDADNQPEVKRLTYKDLQRETAKFASVLKAQGVKKGDVVTIYMGMVPELAIACLACARIGAPHSVIFGGFSAQAIADRITDANSKLVVTCDGLHRRGKVIPLKAQVDEAIRTLEEQGTQPVERVICVGRCHNDITWNERDRCYTQEMENASADCPCEHMDAEDTLFLLYTSGSTGKPKGIQHTTAGYMVYTYLTAQLSFNLVPDKDQVYWCTADIGWITGHSYILYGILPNRVPTLMYEGAPNFPDEKRFWQIIERHHVTQFYTAPTAIRAFMKWGDEHPSAADLSSLQVLGTVGEPINPEAWMWYRRIIGGEQCPIVDTYWQTETGGHLITPLPGATPTTPGSCTRPALGVDAAVVTPDGEPCAPNEGGILVVRKPWPGMLRGVYGDRQRYIDTYWSTVFKDGKPYYTAGDGAKVDERGNFWIMGRIDDVINVSGHRIGTMEVESSLVAHPAVVEAAVVGIPHEIKGTAIAAFCSLAPGFEAGDALRDTLKAHVAKEIGSFAKPDQIRFAEALPKTRSGKIMRRLLRDIASGVEQITQDTSTLEDHTIVDKLRSQKG
ncbi:MAG: acetate--CoA ligase [Phycisphaerales bacterium]